MLPHADARAGGGRLDRKIPSLDSQTPEDVKNVARLGEKERGELQLAQEFAGDMLGVRRVSVTHVTPWKNVA